MKLPASESVCVMFRIVRLCSRRKSNVSLLGLKCFRKVSVREKWCGSMMYRTHWRSNVFARFDAIRFPSRLNVGHVVRKFSYFHNLLGVKESASNKEIKQAFRILALKYHPDREGGDKEMFQKVREAYEKILKDDDLRKEDEVLEAMRQAYVRGNTSEVWSLWENEIMEQKMPMGHEAFSYMFGACERGSVLEELNRAKEFGVLHGKEMEEAVYNAFLQHVALDMTSKGDIDFAMEVIDIMDKLHLTVDQRIAREVFSYMSGVS